MPQQKVTKVFTITADVHTMQRFERFLGFFHYNGGHSGVFAMYFDGDGWDTLKVEPPPPSDVDEKGFSDRGKIATGQDVEIAGEDVYSSFSFDAKKNHYIVKDHVLYRVTPDDHYLVRDRTTRQWVEVPSPYRIST